jgi:hypothetical protein
MANGETGYEASTKITRGNSRTAIEVPRLLVNLSCGSSTPLSPKTTSLVRFNLEKFVLCLDPPPPAPRCLISQIKFPFLE